MDDLCASQSDLTNFIATVIRECRDDMVMPFIVCAVGPNGSVAVSRVDYLSSIIDPNGRRSVAKLLSEDEARRIAAKLPELLRAQSKSDP